MEHCRWEWIRRPELGLVDGLHGGHFFVVHRQTVALARTFGIGTRATVRAALRSVGRVQCEVEQVLVRDDGALLARAQITAVWLGPSGQMARIPEATRAAVTDEVLVSGAAPDHPGLEASFLSPPEVAHDPVLERLVSREVPAEAPGTPLVARRSDCDMFGHVNGSSYVRYFEDALGRPALRSDVEYRGQARAGDALVVRRWEPGHDGAVAFALERGEEVLCRAVLQG